MNHRKTSRRMACVKGRISMSFPYISRRFGTIMVLVVLLASMVPIHSSFAQTSNPVSNIAAQEKSRQLPPLEKVLQTVQTEIIVRFAPNVSLNQARSTIGVTKGAHKRFLSRNNTHLAAYGSAAAATSALKALAADPGVISAFYNQRLQLPVNQVAPTLTTNPLRQPLHLPKKRSDPAAPVLPDEPSSMPDAPAIVPNDALRTYQWYLDRIGDSVAPAPPASAPTIAVIDSGVDYTHPELASSIVDCPEVPDLPCDLVALDQDPMDTNGHGSHVAGTIAAPADAMGITGVSPHSKILPVRIFGDEGFTDFMTIFAAIDYTIAAKAEMPELRIANMSFGGYVVAGSPAHIEFNSRLNAMKAAGILPVAAAGNDTDFILQAYPLILGIELAALPAQSPAVLAVAATDENDYRTFFSNYSTPIRINSCTVADEFGYCPAEGTYTSKMLTFATVAAPGWLVLAPTLGGQYSLFSGTSMASPIVAGAAARIMSSSSTLTNNQVIARIRSTGVPLGRAKGFPIVTTRVDLRRALGNTETGFTGRVVDAVSGRPVKGARVTLRAGSTVVTTTATNSAGFYTLIGATPAMTYTLVASKVTQPRYIQAGRRVTAIASRLTGTDDLTIVPLRTDGSYTMVLEWRNVLTGYDEWARRFLTDAEGTAYPWPIDDASLPFALMDTYSSVPHPDQRNDSIEFAWNNPGSLVGFPYTRHMHHWTTDLSPHGAVIIRELPPTGPFRLGIKWFSAGGAARPGASVSLYRNGSLLKRSYLSLAPTDGTSGNRVWALYSLSSDGTIGMPGTDPNGLRSDYGAWIHRNNDIPGLPGPAAGQTVQGQLDGIAEDSVSMPLTDIVDVYNVALAAGQTYTFTLSGPADTNFDLYLFGPSSFSIYDSFPIAGSTGPTSQETFAFTVPPDAGGRYYLVLYAFQGAGTYTLSRP